MTLAQILAFMLTLVGHGNAAGQTRYANAILAVPTEDVELQAALIVTAREENWFHLTSYPPFGLTWYVATHPAVCLHATDTHRGRATCTPLSIEEGALRAAMLLRFIRTTRCGHSESWGAILGFYRRGHGCYPDATAVEMVRRMATLPSMRPLRAVDP